MQLNTSSKPINCICLYFRLLHYMPSLTQVTHQGLMQLQSICLGHDTCVSCLLSSCHGAILASVVMGEAPDVLVITHTSVLSGSGHPCSTIDRKG